LFRKHDFSPKKQSQDENMTKIVKRISLGQQGFTITEVLVAMGLSGLVLVSAMTSVNIMNSMRSQQRIQFTRNEISSRLRTLVLTPGTLENSAIITNNLGATGLTPAVGTEITFTRYNRLMKCHPAFTDPSQTGCDRATMDVEGKGNYVYISDRNSTDPAKAIAGEYIYYNLDGARCTQAQAADVNRCPIYARAYAEPYCLNFASTCNKAMSISVRYSVGVRDGYTGSTAAVAALEGEMTVPLQKGIQITRILDQDNNPMIPNAKGIYGVQKYYGYPDQAGNPRALRFEVLVGNPTGLKSIRMQMRSMNGSSVIGLDDLNIPDSLNSVAWSDVPNPDDASQAWVISLQNASQNQLFNFGTVNTIKGFTIGAPYNLPNDNVSKRNYLYYLNPAGTGLLPPLLFKSGLYQFRVVALDTGNNKVESTNYATVRIFSRPQMYLSSGTPIPPTIYRNCVAPETGLNLTVLAADDEQLVSSNYTISNAAGVAIATGNQTYSDTTGSFQIVLDKTRPAGTYLISHKTLNKSTGLVVRGFPLPETSVSTLPASLNLTEVTPVTDLVSNPLKVRTGSSATASYSYTTGNCCNQTPTINWTFPNVPEAGGVAMLSSATSSSTLSCVNNAGGTRTCSASSTILGQVEGPVAAAPDISATLIFPTAPEPACSVSSLATNKYIQVIKIPGIQFASAESLWVSAPAGAAAAPGGVGGSIKAQDRKVRVKADFPPAEDPITVEVRKTDGTVLCNGLTFAAGTTVDPVYQECAIPTEFSGDMILTRTTANIKTSADAAAPTWRAQLVDGKLQHRVCNADLGSMAGNFPLTYTVPFALPMFNSPWGLDNSGMQKPTNDTGQWGAGTTHTLKCWDNWTAFNSTWNKQDGLFAMDSYNAGRPFTSQVNISLGPSFPIFFFPYNGSPAPDFSAKNVPYVFTVTRGIPRAADYRFAAVGVASSSTSTGHPWTNVTGSYCNGGTAMTELALYVNQFGGFDSATQTMKAVNSMSVTHQVGTHYSYSFVCTYGNYKLTGE
jgi:prepilin-type N-terminal cleavage/methylation domain-containing protein